MSQQEELAKLIEEIGAAIEERLSLSPLASRIYALLILSSFEGRTFEEIREIIKASKSSTSVNINVLIQLKYISFYTKPGDRKRYFKLVRSSLITTLEAELQRIVAEMSMVGKINNYNKEYHQEKFRSEESLGSIFQKYLIEKQHLLETTIDKMKAFNEDKNR